MANTPIKFAEPPKIPLGSLILVTGANGLIASHVADQLLAAGYRVRGTVRNKARCAWLESTFISRYGECRFELVEVSDLAAPGVWEGPVRGVAGIASVAGCADLMVSDVDEAVEQDLKGLFSLLATAKSESSVKSFVLTSSSWAAWTPEPNVPITVTVESWNEKAVTLAADVSVARETKGILPFMAVKVKVEKACWDWVAREKPGFTFNTILPDTTIGPILDARNQTASTSGMVMWLYNGEHLDILSGFVPQWCIDARDTGRLYVAALVTGVDGWRVFGCAERFSWNRVLDILKRVYPEKDFVDLSDNGDDQAEILSDKPLALLRAVGQDGWTSLEQSVKDAAASALSAAA
ncbi:hypothetical protein B0H66DRAFT_579410 [Apodospora peruviana]|uniref:NAD-dependent epimerase/dehydratase domain-containing protein n=1 Tax=Apodospora peruviana TaxID=516989 RepID=A0AAE0MF39_9PEZI|nr:hypothetical protein B0H66DRAFT_579410 [Apodospora peruviana]